MKHLHIFTCQIIDCNLLDRKVTKSETTEWKRLNKLELTFLFTFCPISCNALIALTVTGGRDALNGSLEPPRMKLGFSSSGNHND